MANTPNNKDSMINEILDILDEFDPNSESYPRQLTMLLDNMNERKYYSGAKQDLYDYIELLKKSGRRNADESDELQKLGKKLRGVVIPKNIYDGIDQLENTGEVITFTRERTENLLNKD